ncbi:MAG: hypothetical protein EHM19_05035, partial [Candidatus Latescibacterota bacterium]
MGEGDARDAPAPSGGDGDDRPPPLCRSRLPVRGRPPDGRAGEGPGRTRDLLCSLSRAGDRDVLRRFPRRIGLSFGPLLSAHLRSGVARRDRAAARRPCREGGRPVTGLVPPAGLRLRAGEAARALAGLFRPAQEARRLELELEKIFPGRRVLLCLSGRAALYRLFRLCRERRKDRDEVVIGAYTCWSVAAAAVRAGFRLRLVDLDPETFDFDPAALSAVRWERVAAVVTHHLFGLPNERRRAARAAEAGGAWLIDDAAQALGASEGGVVAGGAGEAGVLSFGRGKSLPALGGGALLLAKGGPLDGGDPDGPTRIPGGVVSALRAAGHGAVYGTPLYGPAAGLSFLHVGETVYDEKFAVGAIDGYTAALARRLLLRSEEMAGGRREAAVSYRSLLAGAKGIAIPILR